MWSCMGIWRLDFVCCNNGTKTCTNRFCRSQQSVALPTPSDKERTITTAVLHGFRSSLSLFLSCFRSLASALSSCSQIFIPIKHTSSAASARVEGVLTSATHSSNAWGALVTTTYAKYRIVLWMSAPAKGGASIWYYYVKLSLKQGCCNLATKRNMLR